MTWEHLVTGLIGLVGGGGATKVASKYIDWRRSRERSEATIASRALDFAEAEREDTQQHATGWRECEKRCAKLEGMIYRLGDRVQHLETELSAERSHRVQLQGELANAQQTALLVGKRAEALSEELDDLYRSIGRQRPSSRPPQAAKGKH